MESLQFVSGVVPCTAEQAADPDHVCTQENGIFLWAWYMLSSIAFSGIIMKITKTQMDLS
ncbi:MAG: hypothetical protein ACR2LL_00425 [Nitrosopumilus sp.]|uniref:hypothetical protein n=1 Tax=Nitrosopumilus sp. TaxID=2024843 RepID=UPI0029318974|nr:hypothetical protein [Nitrosopumilus sp.]